MASNSAQQFALNFSGPLALLTVDELYEKATAELLQKLGEEDRRIEHKPSTIHTPVLGEYFSMWANTVPEGGIIVVGMADDRSISGCKNLSVKQVNKLESTRIEHC